MNTKEKRKLLSSLIMRDEIVVTAPIRDQKNKNHIPVITENKTELEMKPIK